MFEDGSDSAVSVVDVDNSVVDGSVAVIVRSIADNSVVVVGISVLFAEVFFSCGKYINNYCI